MGNSATRRHKRYRGMRAFAALAALSIAGSLTLGTASMAMADEGTAGDTVATTQVDTQTTKDTAQSSADQTNVAPKTPEVPAPSKDTVTKDVAPVNPPATKPEVPAQDSPAKVVEDVTPIAVPAEGKSTPVTPAPPVKKGVDTSNDPPIVGGGGDYHVLKLFVCKYVGTPGVDERLQTGQNPISVSVNSLQQNQWTGAVPGWFSDAHDRSYALAFDEGQPEPSVSECPLADAPDVPEVPDCVQTPSLSYTFDGVGSGVVTVSAAGAKQGDALCDALAVRATTYEYDRPASGNPSWPQTLVGYNDVTVGSIGTFSYAAPALDVCRQHDIYAEFESHGGFSALAVPEKLNGSNDPYEPPFLHQTLAGKGPNPTYSTTTSEGCNTPSEPEVVTGTGTFETLSCKEGSRNWAELDAVPGGVWTFTDKNGGTYKTATGEGFSGTVPGGLAYGDIVVSLDDTEDTMNGPSGYDVTPWSDTWTTVDPESLDCNVDTTEPEVVTGTATFETLSCADGSKNWAATDAVKGGVWIFLDKNGERFVTESGKAYTGGIPEGLAYGAVKVELRDGDSNDNYSVTPWDGTWTTVDANSLDCDTDTPPTDNPPVNNPPVDNPPANNPPAVNPPANNPPAHNPPANNPPVVNPPAQLPPANNPPQAFVPATDRLPMTGTDVSGLAITAGLLVLSGLATMVFMHRRRVAGQL